MTYDTEIAEIEKIIKVKQGYLDRNQGMLAPSDEKETKKDIATLRRRLRDIKQIIALP